MFQNGTHIVRIVFACICLAGIYLSFSLYYDLAYQDRIRSSGQLPNTASASPSEESARKRSPQMLVAMAEIMDLESDEERQQARTLLREAVRRNPDQPFAWARLAHIERAEAGHLNAAGISALRKSIEQCPLCQRDLLKWRLSFVVSNWSETPEDIRLSVFEGADLLRWWHGEGAYLARMRQIAAAQSVPFAAYQRKIATPVRANELPR